MAIDIPNDAARPDSAQTAEQRELAVLRIFEADVREAASKAIDDHQFVALCAVAISKVNEFIVSERKRAGK